MKSRTSALVAVALGLALARPPFEFVNPEPLPAKRIIASLGKLLKKRPNDPDLHYKLARVHYLALINQTKLVPTFVDRGVRIAASDHFAIGFLDSLRWDEAYARATHKLGLDKVKAWGKAMRVKFAAERKRILKQLEEQHWHPPAPSALELEEHAKQAMAHFDRAVELKPKNALYRLGRACLAKQCFDLERASVLPRRAMIKSLAVWTEAKARAEFYATFKLTIRDDVRGGMLPAEGLTGLVSHEAAIAFLRLAKDLAKPTEKQQARIAEVEAGLKRLRALRRGIVTPILIGRSVDDTLQRLVAPKTVVEFDLDGDGVTERWPWVRADAGILVWDPTHAANIRSGRQLFGSVTWFLFHRNGFDALQLLDDDQDGVLTGAELVGLAIWTDRNQDGRSTASEVVALEQSDIVAIRVRAQRDSDGVLGHASGVQYADGTTRPTFDWVTGPAR